MDDLRMRYEAPNESNRWDFPLFKVTTCADQIVSATAAVEASMDALKLTAGSVDEDAVPVVAALPSAVEETAIEVSPVKSSFTSSWKPKKKVVTSATPSSGDDATVFTAITVNTTASAATTTTQAKAISFSGTMVVQEDTAISGFMAVEVALTKISDYFGGAVAAAPNSSTIATQRANADLLYELDRVSQQIIQVIVAHQTEGMVEGTPLKFLEYDRALTLNRHTGLAELQRYRRQYVKINGQHPPTSSKAIGTSFIDYLALHI
jgi:tRNA uridine 5-carbamoylmethylation protein Kti12